LWEQRIQAGAAEHGSSFEAIVRGLARCTISLNRKTLANLAIWEPRTFKVRYLMCFDFVSILNEKHSQSLTQVASAKLRQDPPKGLQDLGPPPDGVITRGML
jgi:large subunit ribosomal protein L20